MQPLPHDWGQAPPPRSRCFFHREVWHSWSLSTFHFPGEMAQFNQISELKEDELSIYSQHRSLLFFLNFFSLASELPTGNGHSLLLHAGSYDFAFICIWAKKGKRDAINWAHSQTPSLVAWARKLNFRTKIAYTKTFGGSRVRGPWAEQGVFGDHTEPVGFCHYLASWPLTLYSEQELMIVLSTGEWLYP